MTLATRGTSNTNVRGNTYDRAARRRYLIETYRANVDVAFDPWSVTDQVTGRVLYLPNVQLGEGQPACRCYRCGELLTIETVTVDRIIPGAHGGTYRRTNIRPACGTCNSQTGSLLALARRRAVG